MKKIISLAFALLLFTTGAYAYNEPSTPAGTNGQIQYNNNGVQGSLSSGTAASNLALINSGISPTLRNIAGSWQFGNSYMEGAGVQTFPQSWVGMAQSGSTAPTYNWGIGGASTGTVSGYVFNNYYGDPVLPNANLLNNGENDSIACTNSPAQQCYISFMELQRAMLDRLSVPDSYRILASNATLTGAWASNSNSSSYISNPVLATSGSPRYSATVNSTLTFSIPTSASSSIRLVRADNANGATATGTYSVSIDGTLQTDPCSGTTTFTGGPCGSNPALPSFTQAHLADEFSVTPNQTHSVVITVLTTGGVAIDYVTWNPSSTVSNVSSVFLLGVTSNWTNSVTWDAVDLAVVNQLRADGLPVFYLDVTTGMTFSGTTYRAFNTSSDLSATATTTCSATSAASHPNSCGQQVFYNLLYAAEGINNWWYTYPTDSSKASTFGQLFSPYQVRIDNSITLTHGQVFNVNAIGRQGTGSQILPNGLDFYNYTGYVAGLAAYIDSSTGLPWSGKSVMGFTGNNSIFWNCNSTSNSVSNTASNTNSQYTTKNCFDSSGSLYLPAVFTLPSTITPGSTPAISTSATEQTITLSANAAPTIGAFTTGFNISIQICQPATGGPYTWTWPAVIHGGMTIGTTASSCSQQDFKSFNGTSLVAMTTGVSNVAP